VAQDGALDVLVDDAEHDAQSRRGVAERHNGRVGGGRDQEPVATAEAEAAQPAGEAVTRGVEFTVGVGRAGARQRRSVRERPGRTVQEVVQEGRLGHVTPPDGTG
jgi:hypothetical protein